MDQQSKTVTKLQETQNISNSKLKLKTVVIRNSTSQIDSSL